MAEAAEADVLEIEVDDAALEDDQAATEQDNAPKWSPEEARIAASLGWSPKEKWRGPESDWKTPGEFLANTREVIFNTRDRNRELEGKMARVVGEIAKVRQGQQRTEDAALDRELAAAVEAGDLDGAKSVVARAKAARGAAPAQDSAVASFSERNAWFNVDPEATAYAQALDNQFAQANGGVTDPAAHMKRIETAVQKRFPELFGDAKAEAEPKPEPKPAPVLGRSARTPGRSAPKGVMAVADMTPDMRRAAKDCGVSEKSYVESFNTFNGV